MRNADHICFLASQEGRRLRARRISGEDDDTDALSVPPTVSWIDISRDSASGRLKAVGSGHGGHENEGRMQYVCAFLDRMVLPYMEEAGGRLAGRYAIELHDSYTYLEHLPPDDLNRAYDNVMVFSRDRTHAHPVLIPDPFQMTNFGGGLDRLEDRVAWKDKEDRMFFAGTTTGNRDPSKNERIKKCVWSLQHRDVADYFITHVAQMDMRDALRAVPDLSRVIRGRLAQDHHTRYRVAVNIAGNTCSWSRVPMVMKTRSVLFDYYCDDMTWYYPAMQDGLHYVSVDGENVLQKHAEVAGNESRCNAICDAANIFVANYTRSVHAAAYMKHLLEASVYHNSP